MPEVIDDVTFLDKKELAKRWKVTPRTLEIWVKDEKIPAPIKVGGKRVLFYLDDVLSYEVKLREKCGMSTK